MRSRICCYGFVPVLLVYLRFHSEPRALPWRVFSVSTLIRPAGIGSLARLVFDPTTASSVDVQSPIIVF